MIDRVKQILSSFFPMIVLALIVSNFVLSCRAYKMSRPCEIHHYTEVTNYVSGSSSYVVSNSVTSVESVTVSSPEVVAPREFSVPYQFLVINGAPCIRYFGRYYTEGDLISFGRIFRIFPDRLFLANGDVVVNASPSPSLSPVPFQKPLPRKVGKK